MSTMNVTPTAVSNRPARVHLFVGNISVNADEKYIRRLFAAYGTVKFVVINELGGSLRHAVVGYDHPDDSDSAVASLHLRYCMSPQVPIIVLYKKPGLRQGHDSDQYIPEDESTMLISEYGRAVGEQYTSAIRQGREPLPLPLETFDQGYDRGSVQPPPQDIRVPKNPPWSALAGLPGPGGNPAGAPGAGGSSAFPFPGGMPAAGYGGAGSMPRGPRGGGAPHAGLTATHNNN